MYKLRYIKTRDLTFENIFVLNCGGIEEIKNKIRDNEVLEIKIGNGIIDYINSSYIMFFG